MCVYAQNTKTASFDKIALIQETAQTRKYDDEGNLLSVTATYRDTDGAITYTYAGIAGPRH